MGRQKMGSQLWCTNIILLALFNLKSTDSATVKDVFVPESPLTRIPRDTNYPNRYSSTNSGEKGLKPEESPEARENSASGSLGKRCIRCDSGYLERYPYDRYRDEDKSRNYDRYDDRYGERDRYSEYDRYPARDRYSDRDRYDRYPDRERYPARDRYNERDRYGDRDRYGVGERDRYGAGDRYRDRYSDYGDRYDPYERDDRYDRYDRYSERGVGYDNRGYDYRGSDRGGYRPWDETYRGTSGFDSAGKGYYFASGRPDYGATSGYGSYGSGGYASGWNYGGGGGGRDDYYKDRGYGGSGGYRPSRDPYDSYRTTSYLYGRPSTTTSKPPSDNGSNNTPSPQDNSG